MLIPGKMDLEIQIIGIVLGPIKSLSDLIWNGLPNEMASTVNLAVGWPKTHVNTACQDSVQCP